MSRIFKTFCQMSRFSCIHTMEVVQSKSEWLCCDTLWSEWKEKCGVWTSVVTQRNIKSSCWGWQQLATVLIFKTPTLIFIASISCPYKLAPQRACRPILVQWTEHIFCPWNLDTLDGGLLQWIVVELISYALILVTLALYSMDQIVVCDRNPASDMV